MPEAEIERVTGSEGYIPAPPVLQYDNGDYLRAFLDLSPSRQSGFGPGSIPVSEIAVYWELAGWDDFLTFLRRIRAADEAFLTFQAEKKGGADEAVARR